ncbi:MAG TPA: hypothetical protein VM912_21185 [Terriglobales bacterium]|nr:hypothetical protein [Terriglobales bacterium]
MAIALQDEVLRRPVRWNSRGTCGRVCRLFVCAAAFLASNSGLAQSFSANASEPTGQPVVEPPIPTSAVANSKNCDRISHLSGQLQAQIEREDLRRIEGPQQSVPLSASGKLHLAIKNFSDPVNIGGTALDSAISNATSSSSSAFGTGWSGFGKRFGMSMSDDGLSEFFSTFLVSSLAHQDPHYHRDVGSKTGRRIAYALSRVIIARSDYGKPMFNYAEFVGTASSSLLENTYHFDRDESLGAVSSRIFVSIGSDAAWNLMNEFLPDIAKHVNPRFFFLRRLAERAAKQN